MKAIFLLALIALMATTTHSSSLREHRLLSSHDTAADDAAADDAAADDAAADDAAADDAAADDAAADDAAADDEVVEEVVVVASAGSFTVGVLGALSLMVLRLL